MIMRFVVYVIIGFILAGVHPCVSSDSSEIDPALVRKVEELEQELMELKREHQERVRLKALDDEGNEEVAEKPEKLEKGKRLSKRERAEKKKQETLKEIPNFSQAEELYVQAQIFLNQKHPDQAKTILTNLCESYPEAPQYILAKYWLGEIGLAARDHTNASIAYGEAYSAYKERQGEKEENSDEVRNRAIESLAKLASCLKLLGKKQDACVTIEQFNKETTNVPYNIQRFARQVSDQLKCQKKPQL